ncbi:alkyl hydroperoxide reductase, partial [Rhodococcus oxybenzonivorans]|nr:alkyl hydroperoxide reductase [Rhodococcus oxybenzonivorans]
TLRQEGVDREVIFEAIRAGSIVAGVAQAVETGRTLDIVAV